MAAGSLASGYEVNYSGSDDVTQWYSYNVAGNANQMVVTHTFKYNNEVLRNYTLLYDKTKKAALWAAFAMNKDVYPLGATRNDIWEYDPAIPSTWQPNLSSSYRESSYERGHQVASADRQTTVHQRRQTCYFSNITPQLGSFNSGDSTLWDDLETKIQTLGKQITGNTWLYVVTGAIFDEGNMTYAQDKDGALCPIPAQYYKCIMKVTYDGSGNVTAADGAAYVLNHEANASLQTMKIDDLELLTGFDFFTNIPTDKQKTAEENYTSFFNL